MNKTSIYSKQPTLKPKAMSAHSTLTIMTKNNTLKSRLFTSRDLHKLLEAWPQAVSADRGDLRVLYDLAHSGAQKWKERLLRPDYYWLGLIQNPIIHQSLINGPTKVEIDDPTRSYPPAVMPGYSAVQDTTGLPEGDYEVSNNVEAIIEIKSINSTMMEKIRKFDKNIEWSRFIYKKLDNIFIRQLQYADDQIRDATKIISLTNTIGVIVFISNEKHQLPIQIIRSYLSNTIKRLKQTDLIIYSSGPVDNKKTFSYIAKDLKNQKIHKFTREFSMMLSSVDWTYSTPKLKTFAPINLVAQISVDDLSYLMYRDWCAGWRSADDITPTHRGKMTIEFVEEQQYKSQLLAPRRNK